MGEHSVCFNSTSIEMHAFVQFTLIEKPCCRFDEICLKTYNTVQLYLSEDILYFPDFGTS